MEENKNPLDVDALLKNAEEAKEESPKEDPVKPEKKHLFQKYKIKDIVFLAIMAAVMLVTGAVMPLVGQVPLFGIIQLALGLQFSIFPTIGMMKVRKPGALFFMSLFCGFVLLFMNPAMFVSMMICALVGEGLVLLIFHGYEKDAACLLAGTVYFPTTLPFLYVWYKYIYTWTGEEGEAISAFIGADPWVAIGISLAVVALCFFGSLLGVIISRELKKSGVMKK